MLDIHGVFLYTDYIMTKKDYIAIGTILNKYSKSEHMILLKLCEYFKKAIDLIFLQKYKYYFHFR